MIIDCHGHYTTAPQPFVDFREAQKAALKDPAQTPSRESLKVSDDAIRESLEQSLIPVQVAESAFVTPSQVDRLMVLLGERRDVQFTIMPAPGPDAGEVGDDEIKAWYDANQADFRAPETVAIEYLEMDASMVEVEDMPTEEELRAHYASERARFGGDEQRLASHILIEVPADADAATAQAAQDRAREVAGQAQAEGADFAALARLLVESGGLGFYNGGAAAGASQRHKHVQWIPEMPGNATLREWLAGLPADAQPLQTATHPQLMTRHCFVRVDCALGLAVDRAAAGLHEAFGCALERLQMRPDGDGLLPPSNLLVSDGWMLLVPRSGEHFEDVSINALAYGGTFFVRDPAKIEAIRSTGPLRILSEVGQP